MAFISTNIHLQAENSAFRVGKESSHLLAVTIPMSVMRKKKYALVRIWFVRKDEQTNAIQMPLPTKRRKIVLKLFFEILSFVPCVCTCTVCTCFFYSKSTKVDETQFISIHNCDRFTSD